MDFFSTQQQQKQKYPAAAAAAATSSNTNNKHPKKRLTQDQVTLLERSFTSSKKLEPELKLQLANRLGVPPRQVAIWYQNKRARWKTQNLELEYNKLQVKLENAMADKRRLERQVLQLQDELRKTKDVLFALNPPNYAAAAAAAPPLNVSCSSSCDDEGGGSSSCLHEDVNGRGVCDQVLQLDELYACLIGAAGSGPSCWV